MAIATVISKNAPSPRVLWLRPLDDTVYVHTKAGWVPMQKGYIARELESGLAGKQDTLTAGDNITIEDGVISAAGGKPYTVAESLPNTPATGDADRIFLVPYGGGYDMWVWGDGAWAPLGDTHEEIDEDDVQSYWDEA